MSGCGNKGLYELKSKEIAVFIHPLHSQIAVLCLNKEALMGVLGNVARTG